MLAHESIKENIILIIVGKKKITTPAIHRNTKERMDFFNSSSLLPTIA